MAASAKDTPCFARFDSALVESHSKSPSTTVGIAFLSMVYDPYTGKALPGPFNAYVFSGGAQVPSDATGG